MTIKVKETHEYEKPMNIEVLESKEVWWAITKEYDIRTDDGEELTFRVAETPKGTDFYVLTDDGWESLEDDNPIHDAFYEEWCEGTLD
jgi:hypothetical protein